ncbi:MAG: hypothetical protein OXR66_00500 [Candidatus Woesearchaeota archaeon]|nr:hypothetical protein [Candidatus Woesearchaeota archaeon]
MGTVDIATMSERGQVAIPADIRKELGLAKGDKILFVSEQGAAHIKRVDPEDFLTSTEPFRKMKKLNEEDTVHLVHAFRKKKRRRS